MGFIGRIGVFFLWVGGFLILLFMFSTVAESSNFYLFLGGLMLILLGAIFSARGRPEKEESTRFRVFKPKPKKSKQDNARPSGGDRPGPQGPSR